MESPEGATCRAGHCASGIASRNGEFLRRDRSERFVARSRPTASVHIAQRSVRDVSPARVSGHADSRGEQRMCEVHGEALATRPDDEHPTLLETADDVGVNEVEQRRKGIVPHAATSSRHRRSSHSSGSSRAGAARTSRVWRAQTTAWASPSSTSSSDEIGRGRVEQRCIVDDDQWSRPRRPHPDVASFVEAIAPRRQRTIEREPVSIEIDF